MSIDSEYHRILSPLLRGWIYGGDTVGYSTPVGILACQRDPLLRKLDATVVASALSSPPPPSKGKNTKKAVLAPTIHPGEICLEVCLTDTVIFPEGGGQPSDTGIIHTLDGTVWAVLQAKRHGDKAIHFVRVHDGDIDGALLAFAPGAKVKVELDQHLLSALLETRLGIKTLSWSLTSYPSSCYVEISRGMSLQEITMIQDEANKLVFEGKKVHVEVEELDTRNVKPVEKLESGRAVGRGLPEDYTGGVHRVVVIDGVDRNPCCGTHLPSLNNLQLFILPHTETLSRSSTTVARLNFLAGPRIIAHLTSTHNYLTSTAAILSCGTPSVPERVTQVVEDRRSATKRIEEAELELARYIATDLVREMQGAGSIFKKHLHRTEDSTNVLAFLTTIASACFEAIAESGTENPYLIILSSSPSAQMVTNTNVVFILGSDDKLVKEVGEAMKTKLGVKGGGKGLKWSGKFSGVWKNRKEGSAVEDILKSVS